MEYTLQNMIVETGLLRNIFQQYYKMYSCLATKSWIKQLWKFVQENKIMLVAPKELISK